MPDRALRVPPLFEHASLETLAMITVVLLSVLGTIKLDQALKQIDQGALPGGMVVTAFLLLVIAGWSVQGGLAHRRA